MLNMLTDYSNREIHECVICDSIIVLDERRYREIALWGYLESIRHENEACVRIQAYAYELIRRLEWQRT